MTRISTIHGIGADEYAGRSAMVTSGGYVPFLSLTKGEMALMLAAQRAKVRAEWYGNDAPQYKQAYQMLENALHNGVNSVKFIGAVPDYLQDVARLIQKAKREIAPASKAIYFTQQGVSGIGQTVIPIQERLKACIEQAKKLKKTGDKIRAIEKCDRQFQIEKLYNDQIESVGHHMLYHNLPENMSFPAAVVTKRILQVGGVQGMAIAGSLDKSLMGSWVETGIVRKNGTLPGVGPRNSVNTSFQLSPDPLVWQNTQAKWKRTRGDAGITGINCGPVCLALLPVIVAALTAAVEISKNVIIQAQGFGTDALKSTQFDWKDATQPTDGAGGFNTNTLLLLGGAAALFLLADDK